MAINPILKKAFEDIDKWEAESQDSSGSPADIEFDEQETDSDAPKDEFVHVSDAAAPLVRRSVKVKGLDEKAVLVQLKRSMFGTSRRDEAESEAYGAGNVVKHLFEDKTCRMADVKAAYSEVYTFVNDNTVPWAKGVRMLNIDHYMDFTSELRGRIDNANAKVADLVANWDYEVQKDLSRLSSIEAAKGRPHGSLANPDNYPHASEIGDRFGIDVRYMPVPTAGDFRVNISDEDKASLQEQLADAEDNASRHVIEQMMAPMQRAVEKLAVPIGSDGSIFRDSLIDNIVSVADRMDRINVSDDAEVRDKIRDLKALASSYAGKKDVLRNSQNARDEATREIGDLVKQMGGLV